MFYFMCSVRMKTHNFMVQIEDNNINFDEGIQLGIHE